MGRDNLSEGNHVLSAEQLFPQSRDDIRRLRADNPLFDEICSDFELIAGMLSGDHSADVAMIESCEGLKDEICCALKQSNQSK